MYGSPRAHHHRRRRQRNGHSLEHPPDVPQLPEMAYLLGRIPPTGQHDSHDCVVSFEQLCVACHGFSALVVARRGEESATVLFDVGPYGDVWLANAKRLAVDLAAIDRPKHADLPARLPTPPPSRWRLWIINPQAVR